MRPLLRHDRADIFGRMNNQGVDMKVKTSELAGAALDWAVAKCEGNTITFADDGLPSGQWEMYSSNWAQGGPIIERHIFRLEDYGDEWEAEGFCDIGTHGPTPLIAAMRAYVTSKLGDEVDIPGELLQ